MSYRKSLCWCSEGCGFVDESHRCSRKCYLAIIPPAALDFLVNGDLSLPEATIIRINDGEWIKLSSAPQGDPFVYAQNLATKEDSEKVTISPAGGVHIVPRLELNGSFSYCHTTCPRGLPAVEIRYAHPEDRKQSDSIQYALDAIDVIRENNRRMSLQSSNDIESNLQLSKMLLEQGLELVECMKVRDAYKAAALAWESHEQICMFGDGHDGDEEEHERDRALALMSDARKLENEGKT